MLKDLHVQLSGDDLNEVIEQITEGNKISAIKYIIEHSNYSLKEAKEIADFIENPINDVHSLIPLDSIGSMSAHDVNNETHDQSYKTIQLDHKNQKVSVFYTDGRKESIDEFHPDWSQITEFFFGKSYSSVSVLFAERKIEESRFLNTSTSLIEEKKIPTIPTVQPARTQVGVEDLSRQSSFSKLLIVGLIIVLLGILFFFGR